MARRKTSVTPGKGPGITIGGMTPVVESMRRRSYAEPLASTPPPLPGGGVVGHVGPVGLARDGRVGQHVEVARSGQRRARSGRTRPGSTFGNDVAVAQVAAVEEPRGRVGHDHVGLGPDRLVHGADQRRTRDC